MASSAMANSPKVNVAEDAGFANSAKASSALEVHRGLRDALQLYLAWHEVEGHTPATIESSRKRVNLFLRFLEGMDSSMQIDGVTSFHILSYLHQIKASGCSPPTIKSRFFTLRSFFAWALEWGLVTDNPAQKLRAPKVPRVRKPSLSLEGFEALLRQCPPNTFLGSRRQAQLRIFATTGMRLFELTSLQLDDIEWRRGLIRIKRGKGQKERWVPLQKEVKLMLLRYLAFRRDDYPCLWVTEERRPMSVNGISNDVVRLFQVAGVPYKDRCHIFRRTWARGTVRQRVPRQYATAVGGWTTPRMLDYYTEGMQDEEEALEEFRGFDPFG